MLKLTQPVVITAVKWTGYNKKAISEFMEEPQGNLSVSNKILTLHLDDEDCTVNPDDYVARGKQKKICHYSAEEFAKGFKEIDKDKRLFLRLKLI